MSRNYLITGLTSGIGFALAESLLSKGNKVFGLGRNETKIEDLKVRFPSQLKFFLIDLSKCIKDIQPIEAFVNENGKFNGMIYCAGQEETVPLSLYTQKKLNNLLNVNFSSAFELIRILSKKKTTADNSSFVIISSVMGELGQPGKTAYCASKAALLGLVKAASLELAGRKIRVNAISPGVVETPMTKRLFDQIGEGGRRKILDMHPLGFGKVEDVVPLIEFLLFDSSMWITGQNIKIDGGYSIQ